MWGREKKKRGSTGTSIPDPKRGILARDLNTLREHSGELALNRLPGEQTELTSFLPPRAYGKQAGHENPFPFLSFE